MKITEKVFKISKTINLELPAGKPTKDQTNAKSDIKR